MEEAYYIQWLQSQNHLSGKSVRKILEMYPEPRELLRDAKEHWEHCLTANQAGILMEAIRGTNSVEAMKEQYESLRERDICFVHFRQKEYPHRLLEIPDPPVGLYYKGRLPAKEGLSVAIVGSRDCSEYGSFVAQKLGSFLGERRITVISGMARGIDGISQSAALAAGGESYGVLGCGVDICYPATHQKLYDQLVQQGGVLSAYPPGTPPLGKNFPPRNRIVSGLADALVVVEARVKSGTLVTVDMALEQGREVFVVPGRVTDRLSDGCNRLLKQGSGVFTDPESFLEELEETCFLKKVSPIKKSEKVIPFERREHEGREKKPGEYGGEELPDLTGELLNLWHALDYEPRSVEEVWNLVTGELTLQECSVGLMQLTLKGLAKQVYSGYFTKA